MEKTITIRGIEVSYDVDALVASARSFEFDEDDYFDDECDAGDDYKETKESFDAGIEEFVNNILKFEDESSLINTFERNAKITQKGELAKNSNQVILTGDVTMNYSNYYGSHSYNVPAICAHSTGVKKAKLVCTTSKVQSSF